MLLLTGLCGTAFGAQTVYVDAGTPLGGDGSSWNGAYRFLQDALWTADPCDQIWVAEGLYQPDRYAADPCGTGWWRATFQLVDGVEIYGGFPAGGGDWDSRDPCIYETILSGDLAGNDIAVADPCDLPSEPSRTDNCFHVLTCDGPGDSTIMDGVTITGGNANGVFPHNIGGGMYNVDTDIVIRRCCFRGNTALYAAGMRNLSGSPTLEDCTFSGNASQRTGGGLYNYDSSPTLTRCTFSNNWGKHAAGMYVYNDSSPILTDCAFQDNVAVLDGGGLNVYNTSDPNITRCTFSGNRSGRAGGGIWGGGTGMLSDCLISDNWAGEQGGGMFIDKRSATVLTRCEFNNNSTDADGGGIAGGGTGTLSDCLISDNRAGEQGGGMFIDEGAAPMLTRCEFSNNSTDADGGGIAGGGTGTLSDCLISDNRAGELGGGMFIDEGSAPMLTRCEFSNNSTNADGGGMYSHSTSDPNLVHCTFSLNRAEQNGGGIAGGGTGTMSFCLFSKNVAAYGGGLHNDSSSVTIRHCTFCANTADSGGGIYYDGGISEVRNCTLIDNTADNGKALACVISTDEPNDLLVINSILWDGGDEVWHDDKVVFSVTYCDVQGGWSGGAVGVGNIDVDPCFVDAANGDYHLKSQAGRWDSQTYRSADFQGDGIVDLTDFAELSRYWLVTNAILQYDLNSDGIIDIVDLEIFARQFLTPGVEPGGSQPYLSADFQGDGIVNLIDFAEFSRYWLMVVDDYLPYDLDRSGIVDVGDLHLFIEQYFTSGLGYWICDSVTSRCIDAGNPSSCRTDEPGGKANIRVNMGAYGGTSQASKTPAGRSLLSDLNNDGIVDVEDLIVQIEDWLNNAEEPPGDLNRNGRVDLSDVALLADDWLKYN